MDSSLQLNNIPLYKYVSLLIHSSVSGHLSCFHFLSIMNNVAMNICVQVFVRAPVFIIGAYISSGVELLGHMVTLRIIVLRMFSKTAAPFYIPLFG